MIMNWMHYCMRMLAWHHILTGISIPDDKMMEHLNELDALLQSDKYAGLPSAFIHRKLMTVNDDTSESDWHELIR